MSKTSLSCRELFFSEDNKAEISVEPDIYFDEKDENLFTIPETEERKNFYTISNAVFLMESTEKLLEFVHTKKELHILRLRLKGKSYREISFFLKTGLASIARFVKKVSLHNPQIGLLLENAPALRNRNIP